MKGQYAPDCEHFSLREIDITTIGSIHYESMYMRICVTCEKKITSTEFRLYYMHDFGLLKLDRFSHMKMYVYD